MKRQCPICNGKIMGGQLNSYDEPPENLYECESCGFTRYYHYYEGYSTYIKEPMFHNELNNSEVFSLYITEEEDFVEDSVFKDALMKVLKEENLTVNSLIENKKGSEDKRKEDLNKRKVEKEENEKRWEKGELNKEEKIELNNFLETIFSKLKTLESQNVVSRIEKIEENGYIVDVKYKYNPESALDYIIKKQKAQDSYAIENGLPVFAPSKCWNCGVSIFDVRESEIEKFGKTIKFVKENIDIERASSQLITGCPSCNRSFVD